MSRKDFRPGEALNDKSQNSRVIFIRERDAKSGEMKKVRDNSRNQHYIETGDEPVCDVVYLPDDGEMKAATGVYSLPRTRLERFKVEKASDMMDHPLDVLQAQTIAATLLEFPPGTIERDSLGEIAGEEIGELAWELLDQMTDAAEMYREEE